jgi:uncharacterized protein
MDRGAGRPDGGRRILADLPKLSRGEGYLGAPSDDVLARVVFPHIRTYDSSRTPKRGERISTPRTLAEVDLSAITAALAEPRVPGPDRDVAASGSRRRLTELEHQLTERDRLLTAAQARIVALEAEATALRSRLGHIAPLAAEAASLASPMAQHGGAPTAAAVIACAWVQGAGLPPGCPSRCRTTTGGGGRDRCIAPDGTQAAHGLCSARAGPLHLGTGGNPGGLKPSGGHYNAGRKQLRDMGLVEEATDLVTVSPAGMEVAGEVPPAPSSAEERLALWCSRLPSLAPEGCAR